MKEAIQPFLIALALIAVLAVISLASSFGFPSFGKGNLEKFATEVINTCSKDSYPPRCYDTEIPKLLDKGLTMEQAFEVTRIIQGRVDNYFFCHVLGHNLAGKETAKDPSKWTSVIARCPTGMCSNGCLHGAAQERFRNDVLTDEEIEGVIGQLSQVCESGAETGRSYTGLEQASCYHSLGHLSMYLTGARITAATAICDKVARKTNSDYTQTCYEGAYMQIFQPLEPEDFGLVKDIPAKTIPEAEKFCDTFSGEHRAACHRESWPLYREKLTNAEGLIAFCSLSPGATNEQRCYTGMFYVLAAQLNFDAEKILPICDGLPKKRQAQCYANSASRFIETDYRLISKAIDLCKIAESKGIGARCYDELLFYSSFNFHRGSPEFNQLCAALPEPWKTKCVQGTDVSLSPSVQDL